MTAEIISLLDRYLAGDCTRDEAEAVRGQLAVDPEFREQFEELQRIRAVARETPMDWDVDRLWGEAKGRFVDAWEHAPAVVSREVPRWSGTVSNGYRRSRSPGRRLPWIIAASASVGLAAAAVLLVPPFQSTSPEPFVLQTVAGQRASAQLPDGSHVVLAPGTIVRYCARDCDDSRTVDVDGEAYFTVVEKAAHPFVVHGRHAVVRVLGTQFSVRSYAGDSVESVNVATGKVSVESANHSSPVILAANERAVIDRRGTTHVSYDVDIPRRLAWVDGQLVFSNTPMQEVVNVLSRWYGVDIRVSGAVAAALPLTSSFHGERLEDVLNAVALATGTTYHREGTKITFAQSSTRQ